MGYGLRFFGLDDDIVGFCKKRHLSPKGNKNTITYSASELKTCFLQWCQKHWNKSFWVKGVCKCH